MGLRYYLYVVMYSTFLRYLGLEKQGLLLIQLGSPESASVADVKKYLKSFLSDPRLVTQTLFWKILLRAVILPKRSPKVANKYASIQVGDQMPLHYFTELFTEGVSEVLSEQYVVRHAYVHGKKPLVRDALSELKNEGVSAVTVIPLYPQFAGAMTSSAHDALKKGLKKMSWQPTIEFVKKFYANDGYIDSLASMLQLKLTSPTVDRLLLSFHGYPMSKIEAGDPYYEQCKKTVALLSEKLAFPSEHIITCFQSKFGPGEWLAPATDDVIRDLSEQGITRIAIASPSFVADNLETLEEIGMEYHDLFLELGGEQCIVIPSLNDNQEWIEQFAKMVSEKLF